MVSNLDETELARLESLAVKASTLPFEDMAADGWGYVVVDILPTVTTHVPALVAEVRRLREEVEAWEWYDECRRCVEWLDETYCSNDTFSEAESTYLAAREAVHADRE